MKSYKLDRWAGCTFKLTSDEIESGRSIAAMAASDRARGIYDRSECVSGDDKSFYSFEWKRASGPQLTIKQGIANRRKFLGY